MITKTCGLTQIENIEAVAAMPVDWLGLIFYPKSPRYMGKDEGLKAYLSSNPPALESKKRVGVFVNEPIEQLLQIVDDYQLDYVQLHGGESAVYCATLQQLWSTSSMRSAQMIKAFRVSNAFDFGITLDFEPYCSHFIFDTKGLAYGGTGHKFDWHILGNYTGKTPFLLSGGIGPDDVSVLEDFSHPAQVGVDLNSKFESEPGIKKVAELAAFCQALKQ